MSLYMEVCLTLDDLPYKDEILENRYRLDLWLRYLVACSKSPIKKRFLIYQRALAALPGSYKLWHDYLRERLEFVRNEPITPSLFETLNNTFERALVTMHKMPRIWIMYLTILMDQKLVLRTLRTFDRALHALPVTQHNRIWEPYLVFVSQNVIPIETSLRELKRYGKKKLERARELFENAVETDPADQVKPLYLQYAKLEEGYGLTKRSMKVYDQASKAVPNNEKLSLYEIYIAHAAEIFGVPKTREIYEQAIESGLPDKDVKTMCLKYAELEKILGEIDRARAIYVFASQFADPRSDLEFWNKWHELEVQHGNEDTFREMLRIKHSVSASYSQTHFILPEYLMQKDQTVNLDEAKDKLKEARVSEDEMAALEKQLAPAANNAVIKDRKVGFVSAGVESQSDGSIKAGANNEDIELPEESDPDEEEKVEITQKDAPSAVFGGLIGKRDENENNGEVDGAKDKDENRLGALGRIKRLKRN